MNPKLIVLFFRTSLDDEDEAKALCQEMIEWAQRERDVHGASTEDFTIQGVVIDA